MFNVKGKECILEVIDNKGNINYFYNLHNLQKYYKVQYDEFKIKFPKSNNDIEKFLIVLGEPGALKSMWRDYFIVKYDFIEMEKKYEKN